MTDIFTFTASKTSGDYVDRLLAQSKALHVALSLCSCVWYGFYKENKFSPDTT
jgi:hypothetical protein